jgi:hypothetical protein
VAEAFVKSSRLAELKRFDFTQFENFNRVTATSQHYGLSGEIFNDAGDCFCTLRNAIADDDVVSGCEWQD